MGRVVRRAAAAVALLLAVVVLAGGGAVAAITAGSQPPLSGTVQVAGLGSRVTVTRDVNGITQIAAGNVHDLFFAQGWVHASERMWQMEVWRRIGAGRLSELFGASQVDTDRLIRTLDLRGAAEQDLTVLSDDTKAVLQAYADGVNAYVAGHRDALGLAFVVAGQASGLGDGLRGFRPEPWTPLDTLTWAKVEAWSLGGNVQSEIFRLLVDQRLGDPTLTDQLFPAYPADRPVIAAPETSPSASAGSTPRSPGVGSGTRSPDPAAGSASQVTDTPEPASGAPDAQAWAELAQAANAVPALAGLASGRALVANGGLGSNNWVVAPSRSATGSALLANDPHLGLSMPSVWYVNGLHCRPVSSACPYDVTGATFPGTPGVILGHNARIAWGATNANPDVEDLVEERPDAADPSRYLTADGPKPFETRTETIHVAGGPDVTFTVRRTVHGPILNDAEKHLAGQSSLYALRWTALVAPDPIVEGFLGIDRAGSFADFRNALRRFNAPAQNFVYADVDGHIGYQMPGYVPVRSDPADHGLRPVPGWDGRHEWIGRVPFDDLPTMYDPPSGRIVTANNPIDGGSAFLGMEYDRGDRAARIIQLLDAAGHGVTLDTMASIQGDTLLRRAARLIPGVVALAPAPATDDGRAVLAAIGRWDDRCETASVGCAAYVTFEVALERAVFDDDLGLLARDYLGSGYSEDLVAWLVGTAEGRASAWWGNVAKGIGASARDVTARALDTAGAWLRRDAGDPSGWTWGRLHRVSFQEPTLGSSGIGPLAWYFNTAATPVDGASGAVDAVSYQLSRAYPDPTDPAAAVASTLPGLFSVTNGPSLRALYDLGDLDASRIVTTTGQSGQPFSLHADDWVSRWVRNETLPLPFSDRAIAAAAAATLVLEPAP